MKRALTTGIVAVCLAAPLSYVTAGSYESGGSYATAGSRGPERAHHTEFISEYVNPNSASPRIIHVPDADERASLGSNDWPNDDSAYMPEREAPTRTVPVHRAHPVFNHAKRHRTAEPKRAEHRRPYSVSARTVPLPAPVEHRAILSAPPPPLDGPTPIRPTPRFGAPVQTPHQTDQHAEAPAPAAEPTAATIAQ